MTTDVPPNNRAQRAHAASNSTPCNRRNGISPTAPAAQIPWQERPAGSTAILCRHPGNPVVGRRHRPGVQANYHGAVATYGDGFVGIFRLEKTDRFPHLRLGWSDDGVDWHIEPKAIQFASGDPGEARVHDCNPRVVKIDYADSTQKKCRWRELNPHSLARTWT